MDIPDSAWAGREGCNEWLNIAAPQIVQEMHSKFLAVGTMAVETNTFGANSIVLEEYGLADRVDEINRAAVANAQAAVVAADNAAGYVIGSVGPTTKLPSLGHIAVDKMHEAYVGQLRPLIDAGVDALLIETCQDILQTRIALIAAQQVMNELNREIPLMASVTVEQSGKMLVGTDIATAVTTLEPFGLFSLGLNCAMGPDLMEPHIRTLGKLWPGRISLLPNAGMPQVIEGKTCYMQQPLPFAKKMREFVTQYGVSIIGGCCGTRPDHIKAMVDALGDGVKPAMRCPEFQPSLSSAYQSVTIEQQPRPFMIGERANANGSKNFRELLLAGDFDGALQVGLDQQATGAPHALDLCVAFAGRDEKADMERLIKMFANSIRLPVVIDSTSPDVIETALKNYPGRALINSINLEDGGTNLRKICRLAKKYGAACIALTIDEKGMAMTADAKLAVATRIYDIAVCECGLRPSDLVFDVLTFTIGSGDESTKNAGVETLAGIRLVKRDLLGVFTTLGLSNISFGLKPASRRILNSMFLHEAISAGLDTAIVDAARILPLNQMDARDRAVALDLIYNRVSEKNPDPLARFIERFNDATVRQQTQEPAKDRRPAEELLTEHMFAGKRDGLEDVIAALLEKYAPTEIINNLLIEAMRIIGEKFGRGEMLLPFVLQSAEVMRRSVELLQPYMNSAGGEEKTVKILLATVAGDVHDIGKNLVDIILSNNGYKVYNIGIKMPAEEIIAKAREYDVDVIGLSGLLVKSAMTMKADMPIYANAGLTQPILLGGAALTQQFVACECVPNYTTGKVVYCSDAFDALRAMHRFEAGTLESSSWSAQQAAPQTKAGEFSISHDNPVPQPPFVGKRIITNWTLDDILPYLNEQVLFRVRWGYRMGKLSRNEYEDMLANEVRPLFDSLIRRCREERIITPMVSYGYFSCASDGEKLTVSSADGTGQSVFTFPRQADAPHMCVADYFHTARSGGDILPGFVVTVGESILNEARRLYEADEYRDYLLLYALGMELAEAMANRIHRHIRRELGLDEKTSARYGFGYSSCPDLSLQAELFRLLGADEIGLRLTESFEIVPELSTAAIVACHPQARYFTV